MYLLYCTVPPTRSDTNAYAVALAVMLPLATTVIVALVTILIVIAKQLRNARYRLSYTSNVHVVLIVPTAVSMNSPPCRTQLGQLSQTNQVYGTPASAYYEDVDVGRAGNHNHTPAIELSQCPAYAPTEVSALRGEEGIYDN